MIFTAAQNTAGSQLRVGLYGQSLSSQWVFALLFTIWLFNR
ncbi:hypothetical protein yinte0001_26640 [Yersinia intermedia ATCC 29909]|nr:hypothetical protein yinte0001_26640 [Yersinia intermedia ATCC 29909]